MKLTLYSYGSFVDMGQISKQTIIITFQLQSQTALMRQPLCTVLTIWEKHTDIHSILISKWSRVH